MPNYTVEVTISKRFAGNIEVTADSLEDAEDKVAALIELNAKPNEPQSQTTN